MCRQVVRRLEAQTHTEVAKLETDSRLRALNAFKQAIMLCDVAAQGWPVLHANNALLAQLGGAAAGRPLTRALHALQIACLVIKGTLTKHAKACYQPVQRQHLLANTAYSPV